MKTLSKNSTDSCEAKSPFEKKADIFAAAWLIGAILIGAVLTFQLSRADSWMYSHNGEFLNPEGLRANRAALASVPSEIDERQRGTLSAVERVLEEK